MSPSKSFDGGNEFRDASPAPLSPVAGVTGREPFLPLVALLTNIVSCCESLRMGDAKTSTGVLSSSSIS